MGPEGDESPVGREDQRTDIALGLNNPQFLAAGHLPEMHAPLFLYDRQDLAICGKDGMTVLPVV